MEIKVNDEAVTLDEGISVSGLLKERDVKMPDMLTIRVNDEVVERNAYDETSLKDGDSVEFIYFMGGGR